MSDPLLPPVPPEVPTAPDLPSREEFEAAFAGKYRDQHPHAHPPSSRRRRYWARLAKHALPPEEKCHCGLGLRVGPDPGGHPRLKATTVGKGKKGCPVR